MDVSELISAHLDHTSTPEESRKLCTWIKADPAHARHFVQEAFVHSRIRDLLLGEQYLRERHEPQESDGGTASTSRERPLRSRTGAPIEDPRWIASPASPAKGPRGHGRWRMQTVRHWLIATSVLLVLALVALVSWAWKLGSKPSGTTLTDMVNAQWEGPAPGREMPLDGRAPLNLKAGVIEISMGQGGILTVEGPAEFTLQSPHVIFLHRGRLAAKVHGGGLTVNTPTARIYDLGTEFGVDVDADTTRVEVFEGKVRAAPATATDSKLTMTLEEGQAARVVASGVDLDPAGAMPQHFVRSLAHQVTRLDVVDLVAGGDGTSHRRGVGVDASSGKWGVLPTTGFVTTDWQYHPVAGLPVVDGVFVPEGSRGPVTVDSAGHQFSLSTSYDGSFLPLWAGGPIPPPPRGNAPMSPVLNGVDYSQDGHGLLAMHANKGLTLDLKAIRRLYPRQSPNRFLSLLGNTKVTPDNPPAAEDAYVLVDGQPRFGREKFTARDGAIQVEVPLREGDCFLTLIVTDGGDTTITFDHVIWSDPVLELGPSGR